MYRVVKHTAAVIIERRNGEILVQAPRGGVHELTFPTVRIEHAQGTGKSMIQEGIVKSTGIRCTELREIFDEVDDRGETWARFTVYRCLAWSGEVAKEGFQWVDSNLLDVTSFKDKTRTVLNALRYEPRYYTRLRERISSTEGRQVVAAGVIERPDGTILVELRRENGRWCHPGGKSKPGETPERTLTREMREELGIVVREAEHLIRIDRPDELNSENEDGLRIEAFRIVAWDGEPEPREGQNLKWMTLQEMESLPRLDAVRPINAKLLELRKGPHDELAQALGTALVALRDMDMGYQIRDLPDLTDAVKAALQTGTYPNDIDCTLLRQRAPDAWSEAEIKETSK